MEVQYAFPGSLLHLLSQFAAIICLLLLLFSILEFVIIGNQSRLLCVYSGREFPRLVISLPFIRVAIAGSFRGIPVTPCRNERGVNYTAFSRSDFGTYHVGSSCELQHAIAVNAWVRNVLFINASCPAKLVPFKATSATAVQVLIVLKNSVIATCGPVVLCIRDN